MEKSSQIKTSPFSQFLSYIALLVQWQTSIDELFSNQTFTILTVWNEGF